MLRDEAGRAFLAESTEFLDSGVTLARSLIHQMGFHQSKEALDECLSLSQLRGFLESAEILRRCEGALGTMFVAFSLCTSLDVNKRIACGESLRACADALVALLLSQNPPEQFAACWAFSWIGLSRVWSPPASPNVLDQLFTLCLCSSSMELREWAGRAFAGLPLLLLEAEPLRESSAVERFMAARESSVKVDVEQNPAVLVAAYYLRSPWSDTELARLVAEVT